eukprot:Nitzschia sp. Nitz4//scaffold1_size375055//269907//271215//NITZ4_000306-RA/size375055-augustus-gene-0.723-mRNA-1//-1//CDS//3329541135//7727//frame0
MTSSWNIGDTVNVQSRTWAGINKPGGCARITKVHYAPDGVSVQSLDVKYVLGGGFEKEVDPAIVSAFETLERQGRSRRGRDFLMKKAGKVVQKVQETIIPKPKAAEKQSSSKQASSKPSGGTKRKGLLVVRPRSTKDSDTSPSTPVSPDQPPKPPVSKRRRLSSIPSVVIAAGEAQVSPLPLFKDAIETKKSSCQRGLFGTHSTKETAVGTASQPTKVPPEPSHSETAPSRKPAAVRRLPSKLPLHKPTSTKAESLGTQQNLKTVFEREREEAKKFLEQVQNAHSAPRHDPPVVSGEIRMSSTPSRCPSNESDTERKRHDEFLSIFRSLRRKFEDEDGALDVSTFQSLVNKQATIPFSPNATRRHLTPLIEEGRLMKSEGVLYIID